MSYHFETLSKIQNVQQLQNTCLKTKSPIFSKHTLTNKCPCNFKTSSKKTKSTVSKRSLTKKVPCHFQAVFSRYNNFDIRKPVQLCNVSSERALTSVNTVSDVYEYVAMCRCSLLEGHFPCESYSVTFLDRVPSLWMFQVALRYNSRTGTLSDPRHRDQTSN